MYPNAGRLDQVQTFQYQWLPKKILFHCNNEVLMHSTSGIKLIFCMSFLNVCAGSPLITLCKIQQGKYQLLIIVLTKPHSQ